MLTLIWMIFNAPQTNGRYHSSKPHGTGHAVSITFDEMVCNNIRRLHQRESHICRSCLCRRSNVSLNFLFHPHKAVGLGSRISGISYITLPSFLWILFFPLGKLLLFALHGSVDVVTPLIHFFSSLETIRSRFL